MTQLAALGGPGSVQAAGVAFAPLLLARLQAAAGVAAA
jgi:hypothetical protein